MMKVKAKRKVKNCERIKLFLIFNMEKPSSLNPNVLTVVFSFITDERILKLRQISKAILSKVVPVSLRSISLKPHLYSALSSLVASHPTFIEDLSFETLTLSSIRFDKPLSTALANCVR